MHLKCFLLRWNQGWRNMPGQCDSHMLGNKKMPSSGENTSSQRFSSHVLNPYAWNSFSNSKCNGDSRLGGLYKIYLHHLLDTDSSSRPKTTNMSIASKQKIQIYAPRIVSEHDKSTLSFLQAVPATIRDSI